MLQKLHIQNYAIIDDLTVNFSENLNIVTGETGAGKSILMGALNLILGQRADSSVLQQADKKCIVEGHFVPVENIQLTSFFTANDLDYDNGIMIRREITPNGKSRSFINDTPVTLSQLRLLSIMLVDLHEQFDTLDLSTENFQRDVLDAFAGSTLLLSALREKFSLFYKSKKDLGLLREQQKHADKQFDYQKFLFDELEVHSFKENELENLDAELKLLSNAENIKQQLGIIYFELKDSDQPLVQQLKSLLNKMTALQQYMPEITTMSERLSGAIIEIKDVADELENIDRKISLDEARVEIINERLSAGYKLLKKHNLQNTSQLVQLQADLQLKLNEVLNMSEAIEQMELATTKLYDECMGIATSISVKRIGQVNSFSGKVNKLLAQVGMPNALLKVVIQPNELSVHGIDNIEFLFDANKSNRFESLGKVASGGELSRLMLSIKSLVAQKLELPTLIFDEIDTGISGEAARQVGLIMKNLAIGHQLIAITHQPQIAAKASSHFFVYKEIKAGKIVTSIRLLNDAERITAIAKMLGGETPTAAAMENAKEMVSN